MEIKTKKHFNTILRALALEVIKEITVTGDVEGYSTPFAFSKKKKKQKKIGVNDELDSKDLAIIKKVIRDVVGDIYRDIWLKRNSWK